MNKNIDYKPAISKVFGLLGIGRKYSGYEIAITAIEKVIDDPEWLYYVTKELYPLLAEKHKCSIYSVERNIRTVARVAYERNPELLFKIARYKLNAPPPATDFLDMIAQYVEQAVSRGAA